MPFIRIDAEPFEYESARTQFTPDMLEKPAAVALALLRALGATHFTVAYDGGNDEGFANPDSLRLGDSFKTMEFAASALATPESIAQFRAAFKNERYDPCTTMSDEDAARYALDELAQALASLLLGDGFGTGEYSLYGKFTANLVTGSIADDPNVPQPPQLD